MAEGLTFKGQVVGIEQSVSEAWKRVEAQKYSLKPTLDTSRFGIKGLTDDTAKFNNELGRATNRVLSFGAAGAVFLTFSRGLKELVTSTIGVEQSLARINVNLGQSAGGLKQFSSSLFDIARNTGQTFDEVAKAAEDLARQGLSAGETLKRVADASKLARIAGISTTDAITGLTAAVNTFNKSGLTTSEIVNKLAAVDTRFAVSSRDLTEAISRTGSAAQEAGVSFDQLIALVTTAKQTTQLSAQIIGTAFGAIFNRTGKAESLKQLQDLGVVIKDTAGNVLPATQLLKNLADAYDKVGQAEKQEIANQVGGVRNINILKATLRDLINANGVYAQSLKVSTDATDEAEKKNAEYNKTLQSGLTATGNTIRQLFSNIGNQSLSPILKSVLGGVEEARKYLSGDGGDSLGKSLGESLLSGISAVLSGPALVGAFVALGRAFGQVASAVTSDLKGLLNLTSLSEQRAQVQARILKLMEAATAAEASQVASASTLIGQKEAILAISQRITMEEEKSAAAAAARASIFIEGGRVTLPRVRGAAGGYLPAIANESRAIAAGVGGASPGARPVVIGNFAFGGGVFGPIVANSDEHIVKNYANGGDAIFNPQMAAAIGLPPGAHKVGSAAGGYVPNAAFGGNPTPGFDINLRSASGRSISNAELSNLNALFDTVRKAGDGTEARALSDGIIEFSQTLNKTSQSHVLEKLGKQFELFDKGIVQAVRAGQARAATVSASSAFEATQTGGFGSASQEAYIRRGLQSFPDYNRSAATNPTANINDAFSGQSSFNPAKILASRGLAQRTTDVLRNPNTLLAASFGLPLLSGFVPEGQGGTGAGVGLGATRGALQGAGTGAIFGPIGAGIGAAIGALIGGFSKATKSVEEFASGLENSGTKEAIAALYGGADSKDTAKGLASGLTAQSLKGINLSLLRTTNVSPGGNAFGGDLTDYDAGNLAAVKAVQEQYTKLGGNFAKFTVTTENVNRAAEGLFRAAIAAGLSFKEAAEAAKKAKAAADAAQAGAGLGPNAFLTRGQGFEAISAFGNIHRGIKDQFQRANITRGAYEALQQAGGLTEAQLADNKDYQRVKGLDQAQNALATAATYLESSSPGARYHQGNRFFKEQIGDSLKFRGAIGTSLTDGQLNDDQKYARTLYESVFKRADNTLKNVGGSLPSQYGSEGSITTGVKSDTFAPNTDKLVTSIDGFVKAVDKLGDIAVSMTLQVDGTVLVQSSTLTDDQKEALAKELTATVGKHFVTKAQGGQLNAKIGALNNKPMPPAAYTQGTQGLPGASQGPQDLTYAGAVKPIAGRSY